jgi:methylmalonyl-CoA/ethylmalonyl-CoA epimerase
LIRQPPVFAGAIKLVFNLHHIGFLVTDISSASAGFVERFGYKVESPIIEDSTQTARVQFLRQPGAIHWLELISPNGPQSKLSQALQHGGGLHHMCYEVANLAAAADILRQQRMLPLGKPCPATAFSGRLIAWFMDRGKLLVELLEAGPGDYSLGNILSDKREGQ